MKRAQNKSEVSTRDLEKFCGIVNCSFAISERDDASDNCHINSVTVMAVFSLPILSLIAA